MFVTAFVICFIVRYYLKQREEWNAVGIQFAKDLTVDATAAYAAFYGAGVATREFCNEWGPKVADRYNSIASAIADRFAD